MLASFLPGLSDIIDLYGSRETGGITRDGVVYSAISVKLFDVPEMGYLSSSIPSQGEICVHSPRLITGYWKEEEMTAQQFTTIDGKAYYHTGDIGELYESMYVPFTPLDCGIILMVYL